MRTGAFLIIVMLLAAPAEAADEQPVSTPGMAGPLAANPHPTCLRAGQLGDICLTGVVSALGPTQDARAPGDRNSRLDLSNGQLFVQKRDGPLQFFVQLGAYSLPSLGTPYVRAADAVDKTYGAVPQAFVRFAPSDRFNIMAGKLPTLMGAEYTFTFENMNVNRGLLWNQENAVNRGVQANYSSGPVSLSVSLNDGYYSGNYNWLSGLFSYALGKRDTLALVTTGNVGRTGKGSFATPLLQNNGELYDLIWTHNAGPWTITPYLQYSHVPADEALGIARSASTYGAAVLANYRFTREFAVAGRAEYIRSSGSTANGAPSLVYGPGSRAWSITLTPTYQNGIWFVRGEAAYVRAGNVPPGFGLGPDLDHRSQARALLEAGTLF